MVRDPVETYRVGPSPWAVSSSPGSRRLTMWLLALFGVLLLAGGAALSMVPRLDSQLARTRVTPAGPSVGTTAQAEPPARELSEEERAAVDTAVSMVRELQSVSVPGNSLPFYRSRLEITEESLRPFLEGGVSVEIRGAVRQLVDVHRAAATAWEADSTGSDPSERAQTALNDVCPSRSAALGGQASGGSEGGGASASTPPTIVQQLWECSATKLTELEQRVGRN